MCFIPAVSNRQYIVAHQHKADARILGRIWRPLRRDSNSIHQRAQVVPIDSDGRTCPSLSNGETLLFEEDIYKPDKQTVKNAYQTRRMRSTYSLGAFPVVTSPMIARNKLDSRVRMMNSLNVFIVVGLVASE